MYYKVCTNIFFLSVESAVFQTKLQDAQRAPTVLVQIISDDPFRTGRARGSPSGDKQQHRGCAIASIYKQNRRLC
jgi:hypothetical protein